MAILRYRDAIRAVKRGLDPLLPDHRGRIGIGGNIVHQRPTPHGLSMLWHSILNYGDDCPASAWLGLYDERLGLELAIAAATASPEWREFVKVERDCQAGFFIPGPNFATPDFGRNVADPDIAKQWVESLAAWVPTAEPAMIARLADLANIAVHLRDRLLEDVDDGLDFSGWKRWELMLIAAKASQADWFDAAYAKLIAFYTVRQADMRLLKAIKAHLDATPADQLCDPVNARERLAARLR
jgi:hypothetical protein